MGLIENWTRELRYQSYAQWNKKYLAELADSVEQSSWRLNYHIQPATGLLNDPNGFSFFNGKWQIFYQAYPMGPVHGLKSWYHLTSENLVDWQAEGLALVPDNSYDSHGVYSGSALPVGDKLFLAYTGNVRDQSWQRFTYQMGAWMNKENHIEKIAEPLIAPHPDGYTDHFRDPQVFAFQDRYVMLVGAQDTQRQGKILTYVSEYLQEWQPLGELDFTKEKMGFMVECPNLIFIDGRPVLLFCPQGLDSQVLAYQNIYPNTYVLGDSFSLEENKILGVSSLKNLDEGFDVYATQAFNAPDGRALAISWIGLPEIEYPTDHEGWAHCLSIVKELKIEAGQLLQQPVQEMTMLRQECKSAAGTLPENSTKIFAAVGFSYELNLEIAAGAVGQIDLLVDEKHSKKMSLAFDTLRGTMTLNRKDSGQNFSEEYGVERSFAIATGKLQLQIFVDTSVVEIFINNGAQTATARVFPTAEQTGISFSGNQVDYKAELFNLRKMM